jgi:hypothetical protein
VLALPFVAVEGLAVLVFVWQRGAGLRVFGSWLISTLVVAVVWLPWLPSFLEQGQTYQTFWIPVPGAAELKTLLFEMTSAYLPHWRLPHGQEILVAAGLLLAVLAGRRISRPEYGYLLTLTLLPVAIVFLVSQVRPIFLSRTLIYVGIPYLVLLSAGAASLLPRWRSGALLIGALLVLNLVSLHRMYDVIPKEDWRAVAAYVLTYATPGELVLFNATDTQIPFDYYAAGTATSLQEHGVPVDVLTVGPLEPRMQPADLARFEQLVSGRESFWLIESHTAVVDPTGLVRGRADALSERTEARTYAGITIYHYRATAQAPRSTGGAQ